MSPSGSGRAATCIVLVLLGLLSCLHVATARPAPVDRTPHYHDGAAWRSFKHLQGARRGSSVAGLVEVKRYLARFGYMHHPVTSGHDDDAFDEHTEAAVKRYQSAASLPVTGQLDSATLGRIASPRCGVVDVASSSSAPLSISSNKPVDVAARINRKFAFFDGEPRWTRRASPLTLTYSVSSSAAVHYLPREAVREAIRSAFARWAQVIPVVFVEVEEGDYNGGRADIKVGFYQGDHGDGSPFDGAKGVLAHAFAPTDGEIHFDAAERWTVDVDGDTARDPIDLETVATHEIGHVLGLEHSSSPKAVMYPYIDVGVRKVELTVDDVEGAQLLYGSNPDFKHVLYVSPGSGTSSWLAGLVSLVCVVLATLVTYL